MRTEKTKYEIVGQKVCLAIMAISFPVIIFESPAEISYISKLEINHENELIIFKNNGDTLHFDEVYKITYQSEFGRVKFQTCLNDKKYNAEIPFKCIKNHFIKNSSPFTLVNGYKLAININFVVEGKYRNKRKGKSYIAFHSVNVNDTLFVSDRYAGKFNIYFKNKRKNLSCDLNNSFYLIN